MLPSLALKFLCDNGRMTEAIAPKDPTAEESWHIARLITAWAFAAAAAVSVVLWVPLADRFEWLALTVGATILVAFVLQLGTAQRKGFITRLSYSVVGGAFLIGLVELVAFIIEAR